MDTALLPPPVKARLFYQLFSKTYIPLLQNNIYLCVITLVRLFNKYLSPSGDQISSHKRMLLLTLESSAASRLPDPKYMPKQSVN